MKESNFWFWFVIFALLLSLLTGCGYIGVSLRTNVPVKGMNSNRIDVVCETNDERIGYIQVSIRSNAIAFVELEKDGKVASREYTFSFKMMPDELAAITPGGTFSDVPVKIVAFIYDKKGQKIGYAESDAYYFYNSTYYPRFETFRIRSYHIQPKN